MSRKILLIFPFVLFTFAICFAGTSPKAIMTYPTAGLVFKPGQIVDIQWKVEDPDSQKFCEQEIFMTVNGTRYQISPEMGANARRYKWSVPNIAGTAVIDLHLGCERGSRWEGSFPQQDKAFTIMGIGSHN